MLKKLGKGYRAVVIGATGGIGGAFLDLLQADPACGEAIALSRSTDPAIELEDEASIAAAAEQIGGGGPVHLIIDASGILPDGTEFYGAQELAQIVASDTRYPSCLADKLFTYSLGRSPRYTDVVYLGRVQSQFAAGGYTLEALATAIVQSDPFRMTHGETP